MSSEGSDTEMKSALPKKKIKKPPTSTTAAVDVEKSQDAKKITTKDMVHNALTDLKSRKGTSLYAIKKYIQEKYKVDVEKLNYIIKKYLKTSVEDGTIVQTKGVGASGSFKLAPIKPENKPVKKKKKSSMKKNIEKPTISEKTDKPEKLKKSKSTESSDEKKTKKKVEISKPTISKEKEVNTKKGSAKTTKKEVKIKKPNTTKIADGALTKTPAKKKSAMMKRKSIGSIIKPPKMNPKKA